MDIHQNPVEQESIDTTFKRLNSRADILYHFVLLYSDYMACTNDYGTGQELTMTEAHMLGTIEDAPNGITVTELAQLWNRTKGAISQTVSRLEKKELVQREKRDGNNKTVYLTPTLKGQTVSRAHKAYDITDITLTMQQLLQQCTPQEIDNFYKVLQVYTNLLKTN